MRKKDLSPVASLVGLRMMSHVTGKMQESEHRIGSIACEIEQQSMVAKTCTSEGSTTELLRDFPALVHARGDIEPIVFISSLLYF